MPVLEQGSVDEDIDNDDDNNNNNALLLVPGKVAKTCTKDGHKQTTKRSTKIQTKRTKKHRTTEEELEGPTSS